MVGPRKALHGGHPRVASSLLIVTAATSVRTAVFAAHLKALAITKSVVVKMVPNSSQTRGVSYRHHPLSARSLYLGNCTQKAP